MSRSLGDGAAKRVGVVSDAEVRRHAVDVARDAALVAASDGVWEFVGSDEAAALVGAQLDQGGPGACADACRALVDLAAQRWRDAEGLYRDDITCVVARLGE
jgi:serine/threonine protein phosphatase PrpC